MARKELSSLLGGAVQFISGSDNYKPSIDSVLLASAVELKENESVLDVGVGSGAVSLCLLNRYPTAKIKGIDISEEMLKDAKANMELNNREMELEQLDIFKWKTPQTFDVVMTNPPFFFGTKSSDDKKAVAHALEDMERWIRQSVKKVRPRGYFYCITDSGNMANVIGILSHQKMGGIQILPIASFENKPAERVIISARQCVKSPSILYSPLVIHNSDKIYTEQANAILREGKSISELLLDNLKNSEKN